MEQEQTLDKQIPTGKIYKDRAIYVGTFLGGPLVAGYLIAENFKVFGEQDRAKKTWLYTIIATVIIFGGIFLIPDSVKIPNQIIPLLYTGAAYYLVKHFQGLNIEAHINAGGEFFSWWRAIGVGLIGLVVIVVVIFAVAYFATLDPQQDSSRPTEDKKPKQGQEKPNDKLVVVKGVNYDDMKSVITGYCNMYNKDDFAALPRLVKVSDREFAITFPYDIEFELYCYFVNYIKYPMDIKYNADVTAWATAKQTDGWITEKSANKKVMLFIPEDDNEHDNVFLTTEDNIGYKLGFAVGEEKQLLNTPKKKFIAPTVDINSLTGKQSENFQ